MDTLTGKYHLHPIIDHFTIALLTVGILVDWLGYLLSSWLSHRSSNAERLAHRLNTSAPIMLIPGAIFAIVSRFTGESEAERVWDTLSPAAQHILFSDTGLSGFLSHAVLSSYLMYICGVLATWRVLRDISPTLKRFQTAYLAVAMITLCALVLQGKTGGELVFNHGAGTSHEQTQLQH
jgi:uncharacterized membrane protein